jgi:hypothetical protein
MAACGGPRSDVWLPCRLLQLTFDGSMLTTTDGNNIRFWDVGSMAAVKTFTVAYPVEAASYCPSKQKFVAGAGAPTAAQRLQGSKLPRPVRRQRLIAAIDRCTPPPCA